MSYFSPIQETYPMPLSAPTYMSSLTVCIGKHIKYAKRIEIKLYQIIKKMSNDV